MGLRSFIEVSFQQEGVHCYPAALTDPKLSSVSYLGHPHRHMFYFYVKIEVFHDDRDIEFLLFKHELEQRYNGAMVLDYKSCEMIAAELLDYIRLVHPRRDIIIRVYEDDENGAILEYTKD